ncbi:hypothetical protein [Paracoccus chinensis]|nr:hypothetical protein [Paracoccus chinensis]
MPGPSPCRVELEYGDDEQSKAGLSEMQKMTAWVEKNAGQQ